MSTPDSYEAKLRLELWRLGEESKRLFDELPDADHHRVPEVLDEMQILQARITDKVTALRAILSYLH